MDSEQGLSGDEERVESGQAREGVKEDGKGGRRLDGCIFEGIIFVHGVKKDMQRRRSKQKG